MMFRDVLMLVRMLSHTVYNSTGSFNVAKNFNWKHFNTVSDSVSTTQLSLHEYSKDGLGFWAAGSDLLTASMLSHGQRNCFLLFQSEMLCACYISSHTASS